MKNLVNKKSSLPILLVLGCLAGGVLRFAGLTRGTSDFVLPEQAREGVQEAFYHFHPDEALLVESAVKPFAWLEPPFTSYGLLPVYLLRGVLQVTAWTLGWEELAFDSPGSTRRIIYTARALAALFSCGTLWLVWVLGRRYFGRWAAGLGVALVAFAPGAIQQAHFFIVDGLFGLLSAGTVLCLLRALETRQGRWYAAAGLLIGATMAVRLNGSLLGGVLLAGHVAGGPGRRGWRERARRLLQVEMWLAGGTALFFFGLLHPFLVTAPELFLEADGIGDFALAVKFARGEILQPWTLVDVDTVLYVDHWFELWPLIAGWPLTWGFLLGTGYVLRRREGPPGLMLLWCVLYFVPVGGLPVKVVRHLVPLLPFMALFTGAFCAWLWQGKRPAGLRRIGMGAGAALVAYTAVYGVAFARIYLEEDSRIQAARWIAEHVPRDSRIGMETGAFAMHGLVSSEEYKKTWLSISGLFYGSPYMLCRTQVDYLRMRIEDVDFLVVIAVNRAAQFTAVPELFPAVADFYERLMAERLGFGLVQRFKHDPEFLGMVFEDDDADPSFVGYDHPGVLIFARQAAVERALARWRQDVAHAPHCADGKLGQVAAALQAGDWQEAQALAAQVKRKHPHSQLIHLLEGEIYRRLGDEERAAASRRRYRPEQAQGRMAHIYHSEMMHHIPGDAALSLAELGLAELAVEVLREGAAEAQRYPPEKAREMVLSYLVVARHWLRQEQLSFMEETLRLSLTIHPETTAYNILATAAYQKGQIHRAIELWKASLSLDATQAEIHADMGKVTLADLRDYQRSLYHLERAVQLDPELGAELEPWMAAARRRGASGAGER